MSVPVLLHLPDQSSLKIKQQSSPSQVINEDGVVTQFSLTDIDTLGLLAHNFREGKKFTNLVIGSIVAIEYPSIHLSDESEYQPKKYYQVKRIVRYRADDPNNPYSRLQDLDTGTWYSVEEVHKRMYLEGEGLTMQTCLERNSNPNWGRLFIICDPIYMQPTVQYRA